MFKNVSSMEMSADLKKEIADYVRRYYDEPYGKSHVKRYYETFLFMLPVLQEKTRDGKKLRILDLGSPAKSHLVETIEHFFGEQHSVAYFEDLRRDLKPDIIGEPYDLILCTEVLEHINEREDSYRGAFTYHGMIVMLRSAAKALKPDGFMVLTTPNVCDWVAIYNVLHYKHPFNYSPHIRELSDEEIRTLFDKTGLSIVKSQVVDCWPFTGERGEEIKRIKEALTAVGYSDKDRGDDLMYLVRRS